jgi:hypothetical protein
LPHGHVDTVTLVPVFARLSSPGVHRGPDWIGVAEPLEQHKMNSARTGLIKAVALGLENLSPEMAADVESKLRELMAFVPRLTQQISDRTFAAHLVVQTDLLVPYWNPLWSDKNPLRQREPSRASAEGNGRTKHRFLVGLLAVTLLVAIVPGIYYFLFRAAEDKPATPQLEPTQEPKSGAVSETPLVAEESQSRADPARTPDEEVRKILELKPNNEGDFYHQAMAHIPSAQQDAFFHDAVLPRLVAALVRRARTKFEDARTRVLAQYGQQETRAAPAPSLKSSAVDDIDALLATANEYAESCKQAASAKEKLLLADTTVAKELQKINFVPEEDHAAKVWIDLLTVAPPIEIALSSDSHHHFALTQAGLLDGSRKSIFEFEPGNKDPDKPLQFEIPLKLLLQGRPDIWNVDAVRMRRGSDEPDPHVQVSVPFGSFQIQQLANEQPNKTGTPIGMTWHQPGSGLIPTVDIHLSLIGRDPKEGELAIRLLGTHSRREGSRSSIPPAKARGR